MAPEAPGVSRALQGKAFGETEHRLTFYLGDDDLLRYQLQLRDERSQAGELHVDRPVPVAWLPGANIRVCAFLPRARMLEEWSGLAASEQGPPHPDYGVLCRLEACGQRQEVWVVQTRRREPPLPERIVELGSRRVGLALVNRRGRLPFRLTLLKFEAPHQPGEPASSRFMSFESVLGIDGQLDTVRLKPGLAPENAAAAVAPGPSPPVVLEGAIVEENEQRVVLEQADGRRRFVPRGEIAALERRTHRVSMNRPIHWPPGWQGEWFGTSFKIAQANHDMPNNPDYSGLQVVRDPGWGPQWIGSLMICIGLFVMFYLTRIPGRRVSVPSFDKPTEKMIMTVFTQPGAGAPKGV
jgi:hypothetical protein